LRVGHKCRQGDLKDQREENNLHYLLCAHDVNLNVPACFDCRKLTISSAFKVYRQNTDNQI
jgi:hypothetical protein